MTAPNPYTPLVLLRVLLQAFDAPTNKGCGTLHNALAANDKVTAEAVLSHLGDILGLSFAAAQVVLNEGKARTALKKSPALSDHPWLTEIEYIDAVANFWKHQGEWNPEVWDTIEGPVLANRAAAKAAAKKSAAHRTAAQLAGLCDTIRGEQKHDGASGEDRI